MWNSLLGQNAIPLNDVIRTGTIERRVVQLTNPQNVLLEAVSFENDCLDEIIHYIGIYSSGWEWRNLNKRKK